MGDVYCAQAYLPKRRQVRGHNRATDGQRLEYREPE